MASSTPTAARSDTRATSGAGRRSSSRCPSTPAKPREPVTDRLYYRDAYLQEFDASVVRVDARGGRTLVVLDRTAFYPTSGGQPCDVGILTGDPSGVPQPFQGRLAVLDVIDDEQ